MVFQNLHSILVLLKEDGQQVLGESVYLFTFYSSSIKGKTEQEAIDAGFRNLHSILVLLKVY